MQRLFLLVSHPRRSGRRRERAELHDSRSRPVHVIPFCFPRNAHVLSPLPCLDRFSSSLAQLPTTPTITYDVERPSSEVTVVRRSRQIRRSFPSTGVPSRLCTGVGDCACEWPGIGVNIGGEMRMQMQIRIQPQAPQCSRPFSWNKDMSSAPLGGGVSRASSNESLWNDSISNDVRAALLGQVFQVALRLGTGTGTRSGTRIEMHVGWMVRINLEDTRTTS